MVIRYRCYIDVDATSILVRLFLYLSFLAPPLLCLSLLLPAPLALRLACSWPFFPPFLFLLTVLRP